jgi:protein-disulfide isomerase
MDALLVTLGVAAVLGAGYRWRSGRLRRATDSAGPGGGVVPRSLAPGDLGAALGGRATLVQFSSRICAACGPTRRMLADLAAGQDGVVHVEVDAEERLDLARRVGVRRTPTVLLLDPAGREVARLGGLPRLAELKAALAEMSISSVG